MSDLLIEPKLAVLDHMKALPEAPMAEDEDFEVWGKCKGTTCFPCTTTFLLITSYYFLSLCDHFQPPAMSFNLARSFADHRRSSQKAAQPRTASPGFVTAAFQIWEAWYYTWSLVYTHSALTKVP